MSGRGPTARVRAGGLLLIALAALVAGGGCFWKKKPEAPKPLVYPLCLDASPKLNWYSGSSHTLYLRVFQLSSLDAFLATDPGRLLDPAVKLPGLEGTPMERTVFPGTKVTLDVRQQAGATHLGVVAGYYTLSGSARTHLPLPQPGDDEEKKDKKEKGPRCLVLGANGIEGP